MTDETPYVVDNIRRLKQAFSIFDLQNSQTKWYMDQPDVAIDRVWRRFIQLPRECGWREDPDIDDAIQDLLNAFPSWGTLVSKSVPAVLAALDGLAAHALRWETGAALDWARRWEESA